jgi:hypothetical protein
MIEEIEQLANVKRELLRKFSTDVSGLLNRVPFTSIANVRVYATKTGERGYSVSGDTQRKVLFAIAANADGELCRLSIRNLAERIPDTHWRTVDLAITGMRTNGLLWQATAGGANGVRHRNSHVVRAPMWDRIKEMLDPSRYESGLPDTFFTALESAQGFRRILLDKYKLASTQVIIDNLCLQTLEHGGKLIGAETQRQVLKVLATFEPEACPLKLPQFAERIADACKVELSPRTLRRTIQCLVNCGYLWQDDAAYGRQRESQRFVRWDRLQPMIPSRSTWRLDRRNSEALLERILAGKKRLLALHGTPDEILAKVQLASASSGSTIVSPERQRELLTLLAPYDRGCRLTCEQLATAMQACPRTVNHVMAALLNQRLIVEHALGNARARILCWDELETLIPSESPRAMKPHQTSDGNIVISSWLPIVDVEPKQTLATSFRAVYDRYVKPSLIKRSRSKSTRNELLRALAAWESHWPPEMHCVKKIRPRHLETFQDSLLKRGLSNATCNKYLRNIRRVLIAANRHGLIRRRPDVGSLPTQAAPKHYLRFADVEAIWKACDHVGWPNLPGLAPGDWWRCAIAMYWIYGFRTQELISFTSDRPSLEWTSVKLGVDTPNPEGTAMNRLGWLTYVPLKQRWAKPCPLYLPLTSHARQVLNVLPNSGRTSERLFPWPQASHHFYATWKELQNRAGVSTKTGEHFETKAMRRSAATYLENHHRGLGAAVIGWADREVSNVMAKHYAVSELLLVEKLESYPVPECFQSLFQLPARPN